MSKALKRAIRKERTDIVKKLVDNGSNVNEMRAAIILSSMEGYTTVLEMLIEMIDNMNAEDWCVSVDIALNKASWEGTTETVKLLVEKGKANVNGNFHEGATCLMEASYQGHIDCVSILLENGADVDERNEDGDTALMWASAKGNIEIVKKLLENGADVNAESYIGWAPLRFASEEPNQRETVRILVKSGANINAKDDIGLTALMEAVRSEDIDIVTFLLQNGADVHVKDHRKNTALILSLIHI